MSKKAGQGYKVNLRLPLNGYEHIMEWVNSQGNLNKSILIALNEYIVLNGIRDLTPEGYELPSSGAMIQPVFDYIMLCSFDLNKRNGASLSGIYDYVAQKLNLKEKLRFTRASEDFNQFKIKVRSALHRLKFVDGAIESTTTGFYKASEFGKECAKNNLKVSEFKQFRLENELDSESSNRVAEGQ